MSWRQVVTVGMAAVLMALSERAAAEIYMQRDGRGRLHFTNAPAGGGYTRYTPRPGKAPLYRLTRRRDTERDRQRRRAFDAIIADAAERHSIDPALVKAVIRTESDFFADARSPKGALGLMQLMPATARKHSVDRVFDPRDNIEGGTRHLRLLLDQYNGNVRLALAAYNAGGGAVSRHGGIPPYRETIEYLQRVLSFREQYLREQ